ncbi:protein BREAST CANCER SUSCEPTIBILITY 2 homolog B-like [Punica granatum]|uniref:Protein BREAST CANCER SUSCEPTIBILITY 2 homolog B-like n=1 Tax=Punica granatum TaxID=22663 RepID=A0A6P8DMR2_PUNGR|nr:protein BREAST CANCER SUSCEPTIBILITY 2 homolog B-like [Punica granatum]
MSTWQLLSADGDDCRWELSGGPPTTRPDDEVNGAPAEAVSRLPSMSDLLLQGCSKIVESNSGSSTSGSSPMFRTGLGKSVAVKQSSVAKALRVLADDDLPHTGQVDPESHTPASNSLFQTGSGKMVNVSSAGLVKAKTLLGLGEDDDHCASQGLGISKPFSNNNGYRSLNSLPRVKGGANVADVMEGESISGSGSTCQSGSAENRLKLLAYPNSVQPKTHDLPAKPAAIKFHTAGGRSLSISSDALKRARSLLGDPELGSFLNEGRLCNDPSKKENEPPISLQYQGTPNHKDATKSFISPLLRLSSDGERSLNSSKKIKEGSNLIAQFNAAASECPYRFGSDSGSPKRPLMERSYAPVDPSVVKDCDSRSNCHASPRGQVLLDISNITRVNYSSNENNVSEKRFGGNSSISPFKRPRSSKFNTPLKRNSSLAPSASSKSSVQAPSKGRVSTRYPFLLPRVSMKEYFGGPPLDMAPTNSIGGVTSDNAGNFMFSNESGLNCIGAESFYDMLIQSGASAEHISKIWVTNHYRWIVWKLACYDRCYPAKTVRKLLTISNVLEELEYRYEREVNHGHRSAIMRILEGVASPSSLLVLCVSAICSNCYPTTEGPSMASEGDKNKMKVELTDGWYSVNAVLDIVLSNHCNSGKVFVGQKLQIWGATLCGWAAPVSPLEATKTVSLLLHVNGTYRAHWADRLGFCKGRGAPLAFRCIKSNGGPVPQTLIGVARVYPILYRERLSGRGSIIRSERMEMKTRQMHNQRRSTIIDGVISEIQRAKDIHLYNDSDSEEGAKISKILETAAEPELLMAEMSPDQLNAFATFRSKIEATRQSDTAKLIEKALQDAGLSEREVTPFMRVKVVGLRSKNCGRNSGPEEGLITIWNPTERQQHDLVEGQAYVFSRLNPINSPSDTLYLQCRGSTTKWRPLTSQEMKNFRPFFKPREAISLSRLGEISLSSEFDIAGYVVYVGEVFTDAQQRRQWVFVTDGSIADFYTEESSNSLLAICFCSPYIDDLSFAPINSNLVGSTVGFCNLIKRAKDHLNHLWVAEARENSTYFLSFDSPHCSHLKDAALSTQGWAKTSESAINTLKEGVSFIIGNWKG